MPEKITDFDRWLEGGDKGRRHPITGMKKTEEAFDRWLAGGPLNELEGREDFTFGGFAREAGSALARGGVSTLEALAGFGEMAGIPGAKSSREAWKETGETTDWLQRPEYLRHGDILSDPGRLGDWQWWTRSLGENLPNMAAMMLPGLASMKAAKLAGYGPKAITWAGRLGAFGGAGAIEAGSAYSSAKDEMKAMGYDDVQIEPVATLEGISVGIVNGILETIPFENLVLKQWGHRIVKRIVRQAFYEGTTELAQEGVNVFVEKLGHKPDLEWREHIGRILEAGIIGAALGGGAGAVFKGEAAEDESRRTENREKKRSRPMTDTGHGTTGIGEEADKELERTEKEAERKKEKVRTDAETMLDEIIKEDEAAQAEIAAQRQAEAERQQAEEEQRIEDREQRTEAEGIDEGQAEFIRGKVRELGSVEAVNQIYNKDDAVSQYARAIAPKILGQETSPPKTPQPQKEAWESKEGTPVKFKKLPEQRGVDSQGDAFSVQYTLLKGRRGGFRIRRKLKYDDEATATEGDLHETKDGDLLWTTSPDQAIGHADVYYQLDTEEAAKTHIEEDAADLGVKRKVPTEPTPQKAPPEVLGRPEEESLQKEEAKGERPKAEGKAKKTPGMTLREFEAKHSPYEVTQKEWVAMQRAERRRLGQDESSGTAAAPYADYEQYHRRSVEEALKLGLPVKK